MVENRKPRLAQEACVRSVPTPIVKKAVFPDTSFVLKKTVENGLIIAEGTETVKLNDNHRLIITNSGCESIALTFQFETNRLDGKIKDPKYLYRRSAKLIKQIMSGLNSPINLNRGIVALENYGTKNSNPELDTEINYGDRDIRSTVRLREVTTAANGRTIVKVIFYYGPL
jgi:hypothetical protein